MNQRCGAAVYVLENKKTPASCEIEISPKLIFQAAWAISIAPTINT